jgi:hypothetical protein
LTRKEIRARKWFSSQKCEIQFRIDGRVDSADVCNLIRKSELVIESFIAIFFAASKGENGNCKPSSLWNSWSGIGVNQEVDNNSEIPN